MRHLNQMIEKEDFRQTMIPDFGFNVDNDKFSDNNSNEGWKKLMNYIKVPHRYERVKNYIEARKHI